jgi:hypothetical protein
LIDCLCSFIKYTNTKSCSDWITTVIMYSQCSPELEKETISVPVV